MATNLEPLGETEERQLCVKCLAPNDPEAHFCVKCGTQLSSYAAIGPYESVFAEAGIYREAAERPHNFIVVLGIWIIFGAVFMGGILMCVMANGTIYMVFGAVISAFAVLMLVKTTRNFFLKTRRAKEQGNAGNIPTQIN
jgi:hypothetical protein